MATKYSESWDSIKNSNYISLASRLLVVTHWAPVHAHFSIFRSQTPKSTADWPQFLWKTDKKNRIEIDYIIQSHPIC